MKEYSVILGGLVKPEKKMYTQMSRPWYINNILTRLQKLHKFDYEIFQQCCFQIITEPDTVESLVDTIKKEFEDRDFAVYLEYGTGEIEYLGDTIGTSYGPVLTQVGRSFDNNYKSLPH